MNGKPVRWLLISVALCVLAKHPATALEPGPAPPSDAVDEEVRALVQELRELPGDMPAHFCTPCNSGSKAGAERRREIYDRLDALGSVAVPALTEMLQSSLQGWDRDLPNTILSILGVMSGPYTSRDGKQHEKTDISAALPALILDLGDASVRERAVRLIGAIGPTAAEAVPKLIAMLDDEKLRADACWGLRGIDPLPALRQAQSDPNPDKQRFAQRAIASLKTKCGVESRPGPLEELARSADLICKATVIANRPASDESLRAIDGFEFREAELRLVSVVKGRASNVIRFRYYAASSSLMRHAPSRIALDYLRPKEESERSPLTTGRTYLVLATQIDGDTYEEVAEFLPSVHGGLVSGPPSPQYLVMSPGVQLTVDAVPHRGTTLTEAVWSELLALLRSSREDDVLEAIDRLDVLSGGPVWGRGGATDFERDEALVAIRPLVEAKSIPIATAAVTVFGKDSPYFYDQDVPFWFVGIGKGHITGLAARKKPTNPAVADIGAKELLQVATDGMKPELRALAIRALGRGAHAYPAAMVAAWARDPNVEVRRAAVLASAESPNRESIITTASTDSSADVRRSAAIAVGFTQDPRLLPLLDKLIRASVADVRNAAALSLLSFPPDQAAPLLKGNLRSDFRPLFVNDLATADPQSYLSELAEVIEEQGAGSSDWKEPPNWNYGGRIPAADSWDILFDYVKSRPAAELSAGKLDRSLDALEQMRGFGPGEPIALYALYLNRGLVSRAKQFRETIRKSSRFNMDIYFDRVDREQAALAQQAPVTAPPLPPRPPPTEVSAAAVSLRTYGCQIRRFALENDTITILPGETLCVRVLMTGNHLVLAGLKLNSSPDPPRTLDLTLRRDRSNGTTLTVRSPIGLLLYHAAIRVPGKADSQQTSACLVPPGRLGIESWPYQIEEVSLSGFRGVAPVIGTFAVPDGGMATVYVGPDPTRRGAFWTNWQRKLFTSPQKTAAGGSFRSESDLYAYDCKVNRAALIGYAQYAGANLDGTMVDSMERSSPGEYEWITPATGSIPNAARKITCGFVALASRTKTDSQRRSACPVTVRDGVVAAGDGP